MTNTFIVYPFSPLCLLGQHVWYLDNPVMYHNGFVVIVVASHNLFVWYYQFVKVL